MTYTNDRLTPAWYTPGWSVQNPSYPQNPTAGNALETNLPESLKYISVVGTFFHSDSAPQTGYVSFNPSTNLTFHDATTGQYIRLTGDYQKKYLNKGQLQIDLLATDNPNVLPSDFTYHVKENWMGGREYDIKVPHGVTEPVDIETLIVSTPVETDPNFVAVEFYSGDSYTFVGEGPAGWDLTGWTGSLVLRSYGTTLLTKNISAVDNTFTFVISPSETTSLATSQVSDYVFRITSSDSTQVETVASGPVVVLKTYGG